MKTLIKVLCGLLFVMSLCGCAKSSPNINQNLGGWLENDEQNEETKDEVQNESLSTGEQVDTIAYNTDPYLSGIKVEIEEYFGEFIVFKVTNDSNNCYRFLNIEVFFTCQPLPNHLPLEEGEEYDNPYVFFDIPAYSTTYYLRSALGEEMSTDKGGDLDGRAYYSFNPKKDYYRIELRGKEDKWDPSVLSEQLIQDASDYVVFDRASYNADTNKLGDVVNQTNRVVKFNGFVIFNNGKTAEIQNGSELIDSSYKYIIPPLNQIYSSYKEDYDCNSIYTKPFDFEGDIEHFDIYINSYFVDEIDE